MSHDFARTNCACENCTRCCRRQPGALTLGDFERIRDALCLSDDMARERFWASGGALVKTSTGTKRVGSITPRMKKGRCVFLNEQNRCSIHAVAPFGCSHFDTHMDAFTAHERSLWLVRQTASAEYQKLRDALPYATSYKPNPY